MGNWIQSEFGWNVFFFLRVGNPWPEAASSPSPIVIFHHGTLQQISIPPKITPSIGPQPSNHFESLSNFNNSIEKKSI